ncbi:ATP-binding protein [Thalassoroseus pseudoceratinae]|uniref:ATP-binding protein n=1 Tax=Thalassoroseus pseudoceratinae TaxID=2713176 RepID=UPI001421D7B5|nr:ATP-binding protein [Thalassoroseus pseudoceratinae]
MTKATLLVVQGVDQGARFEVGREPIVVGRGTRSGIRILDTEVSRSHAQFLYDGEKCVVEDLGSSNGTLVNGTPIRRKTLRNGDRVQIGRTQLAFRDTTADESAFKVDLRAEPEPQSSIVSELEQNAGDTLLRQARGSDSRTVARSLQNLRTLYRISEEAVQSSMSLSQLLRRMLDLTLEAVGADRGCILLDSPTENGKLEPQALSYRSQSADPSRMPVSRSIVDYVLRKGQSVRTSDARRDRRFPRGESIVRAGIREAMCVPVPGHHATHGVVYVDITSTDEHVLYDDGDQFSEDQLRLLAAVGRQVALTVENNRYQTALLKAERLGAMGQTIAMLSHHIKNILQGVRGGSYLIDTGLNDHNEDLVRKGWGIVEKNQNKIYHLVMDMLTFSKDRQPALELANVNETVADVLELMQARADEVGVKFDVHLDESLPNAMFDAEGIHRAVLNIVINAIDAVEDRPGAAIRVQTGFDADSESVFIAIADNGPGIPADQLEKIFQLFESTKGSRGTGLGLAVSQKILREHGGEITVQSKPNEGCQFVLAWPRLDDEDRNEDGLATIG